MRYDRSQLQANHAEEEKEMNILVSACLLGVNCRYNVVPAASPDVQALMERYTLIPVCPEQLGGLPTPRESAEILDGGVFSKSCTNVTESYHRGTGEALRLAKLYNCKYAILKERSPSCGYGRIYDGSFSGTLTDGNGITAALLAENGIMVLGESQVDLIP